MKIDLTTRQQARIRLICILGHQLDRMTNAEEINSAEYERIAQKLSTHSEQLAQMLRHQI